MKKTKIKIIYIFMILFLSLFIYGSLCIAKNNSIEPPPKPTSNEGAAIKKFDKADTENKTHQERDQNDEEKRGKFSQFIPFAFSGLIAALVTILISIYTSIYQRWKQGCALITVFASELVFAFHRCIIYYRQRSRINEHEISKSELFEFTNASSLSDFAVAGAEPGIVEAIIYLKSIYFQVSKYVKEAAKYVFESDQLGSLKQEHRRLWTVAITARNTALTFFLSYCL
jgi:hypothetical protein